MVIARNWKENEDSKTLDVINIMADTSNIVLNKNENINKNVTDWNPNHLTDIDSLNGCSRIVLICQPNSHPFQTRTIILKENTEIKVGRSIARSRVTEHNAIFDCKVLSRNHAVLWYSEGKFFVKDTKSSNGTFINERRVVHPEAEELSSGDIVKFGVDVIENTRKEIHGCIIACVKLYLPDGKEYISNNIIGGNIGSNGSISTDELYRLHHYMQETIQRENMLQNKLQGIQNILDMTRKNTSNCWQAMVDEDRLLNRIDVLENKLKFYQKNCPDERINEDIIKLQEDKFLYQNLAKEALQKVYQERMEAIQKLTTVERALCSSEDECSLLRDQLLRSQQNLQEVNARLQRIEDEYNLQNQLENEQKDEEDNNIKADSDETKNELASKDKECENYKSYINELLAEKKELRKQLDFYQEPDSNVLDAIFVEENFIHLKENIENIEKNLLAFENCTILKEQNQLDEVKNDNDSNENIEESDNKNNKLLLKENIHTLIDICTQIFRYLGALKQLKMNIGTQLNVEDILSKINALEIEQQNSQIELKSRPTITEYKEKLNENESLIVQLNDTKNRYENLLEEMNTIKELNLAIDEESVKTEQSISSSSSNPTLIDENLSNNSISNNNENIKINDDTVQTELDAVNNINIHHEEELIIYKEKYENILTDNRKLKNEIDLLKSNSNKIHNTNLIKFSTFGAVVVAIFCYILIWYF